MPRYKNHGTSGLVYSSAAQIDALVASHTELLGRYLMLFDGTATPNNGDTPIYSIWVAPGDAMIIGSNVFGVGEAGTVANGIVFGWSSTPNTYTASAASTYTINLAYTT